MTKCYERERVGDTVFLCQVQQRRVPSSMRVTTPMMHFGKSSNRIIREIYMKCSSMKRSSFICIAHSDSCTSDSLCVGTANRPGDLKKIFAFCAIIAAKARKFASTQFHLTHRLFLSKISANNSLPRLCTSVSGRTGNAPSSASQRGPGSAVLARRGYLSFILTLIMALAS
jgi:hypothetical protein